MKKITLTIICGLIICTLFAQQWRHSLTLDTTLDRHYTLSVSGGYLYDGTTKGLFQFDGTMWRGPFIIPDTLSWEASATSPTTSTKTSVIRYLAPSKNTQGIWVATLNAFARFEPSTQTFSNLTILFPSPNASFLPTGLPADGNIADITTDKDGNLLIAAGNYLLSFNGASLDTVFNVTPYLSSTSGYIRSLLVHSDSLWISTSHQLFLLNGGQLVQRFDSLAGVPKKPLNGGGIHSRLGLDTDGSIWFVSDYGLVKNSDSGWVHFPTQQADHVHHRWTISSCSGVVGSSVLGIKLYDKAEDTVLSIMPTQPYLSEVYDIAFLNDTMYLAGPFRLLSAYSKKWACGATNNPTNLDEVKEGLDFSLYPNPGRDITAESTSEFKITIQNTTGQIVQKTHNYQNRYTITNLPSGLYLLKIEFKGETSYTKKFFIE